VRREQILDAAVQVFLERGLSEATIADVAAAAGSPRHHLPLFRLQAGPADRAAARYTSKWLA